MCACGRLSVWAHSSFTDGLVSYHPSETDQNTHLPHLHLSLHQQHCRICAKQPLTVCTTYNIAVLQIKDCLTEYVVKLINLADFEAKKLQSLKTSDALNLISFSVPDSIGH